MSTATTTLCSECWSEHSRSDLVNIDGKFICGSCKDRYLQRLHEGVQIPDLLKYAGFWIRLCAKLLDVLIIFSCAIIYFILVMIIALGFSLHDFQNIQPDKIAKIVEIANSFTSPINIIIWGLIIFLNGRYGATPGKMILGLKIVKSNSERLTYLRAFCRMLAEYLSAFTFGIGYLIAAFTEEKTSLHDIICDTRVIKK